MTSCRNNSNRLKNILKDIIEIDEFDEFKKYKNSLLPLKKELDSQEDEMEDIDFILINRRTGEKATLECKSDDTYQYGNFAFESVKNTNTGDLGWALTTTAQYITIYYPAIDKMYLLDGPKAIAWFAENQHRFKEITNSTARREGGALYHSSFRIVNRELFARESGAVIDSFIVSDFLKEQAS